jgi:hypothetical protein
VAAPHNLLHECEKRNNAKKIRRDHKEKARQLNHQKRISRASGSSSFTMASDFNMERLPRASIVPRILHDWSVHHSIVNNNWIATISRTDANDPAKLRYHQFSFTTEREARKFCVSYAPPKLVRGNECRVCHVIKQSLCHCRNCGVTICERCSSRWSTKMLPKTYHSPNGSTFGSGMTRVCKSCDWISNAFCLALLQGRYQDAIEIHSTVRIANWSIVTTTRRGRTKTKTL